MNVRSVSLGAAFILLASVPTLADPARDTIVAAFAEEAKKQDAGFSGFSAERGEAFWTTKHTGGKPDTPSCTSCHGPDPTQAGQTRAGKPIDAMAVSKSPKRFTDPAEVAKWFTRNCNSVLGRECTAIEKGDVLAYLASK